MSNELPEIFRPILWSLRWDKIDPWEDRVDIIVNAVNEGNLEHWRWLINNYGKEEIAQVLEHRLVSEFHPESLHLAKSIFGVKEMSNAR